MARKVSKIIRSKGERLGWTPLDKALHISLSSVTVHGRRVYVKKDSELTPADSVLRKFLVP